jgi:putative DNA primase/helicase
MQFERIQDRAIGRWRHILPCVGIAKEFLVNKHGPCPMCGGKDRWRFDDKGGRGTFFCSNCGSGSGVDLVMKFKGLPFIDARKLIDEYLPDAKVEAPKPSYQVDSGRFVNIWRAGQPLNGSDPASWYLRRRGIAFERGPAQLRFVSKATYVHENRSRTEHPAMAALYVSPDTKSYTVHFTYLDAAGNKADLPKQKKLAPGRVPPGGAVRLANSAETMGIAEGIETALSASQLFDIPVWSALSAGGLVKWQPPATARHIIVFGDNDSSHAGQAAAHSLVHRLKMEGLAAEVRIPDDEGDWNDVLLAESMDANAGEAACSAGLYQRPAHAIDGAMVHQPMEA